MTPETQNTNASQKSGVYDEPPRPSNLAYFIGVVLLGTSAGFTLYAKRSPPGQALRHMDRLAKAQQKRNPPRIGPPTKAEYEKMRNRWNDDDDDDSR